MSKVAEAARLKATQVARYLTAHDNLLGCFPKRTFTVSRMYGFNGKVLVRVSDRGNISITYTENTLYRRSSKIRLAIDRIKGLSISGQLLHGQVFHDLRERDCYPIILRVLEQTFPDTGVFS